MELVPGFRRDGHHDRIEHEYQHTATLQTYSGFSDHRAASGSDAKALEGLKDVAGAVSRITPPSYPPEADGQVRCAWLNPVEEEDTGLVNPSTDFEGTPGACSYTSPTETAGRTPPRPGSKTGTSTICHPSGCSPNRQQQVLNPHVERGAGPLQRPPRRTRTIRGRPYAPTTQQSHLPRQSEARRRRPRGPTITNPWPP